MSWSCVDKICYSSATEFKPMTTTALAALPSATTRNATLTAPTATTMSTRPAVTSPSPTVFQNLERLTSLPTVKGKSDQIVVVILFYFCWIFKYYLLCRKYLIKVVLQNVLIFFIIYEWIKNLSWKERWIGLCFWQTMYKRIELNGIWASHCLFDKHSHCKTKLFHES